MKQDNHGRPRLFSDLAIITVFMVQRVFSMLLISLQGFINFVL
ncbi:hypothetical protein BTN50_0010 [Candidatus Enterovibrio altilux]|uniref:Transposase DDE domain-containing protein n=1 Tax=Candidatus Enterovibrio altilux TaxID=1927128 RepID=A0A291B6E3_9GAMM|nr:hypothetical protein BTN50_0010 [Candidatus Enterovibrio luxaltus]